MEDVLELYAAPYDPTRPVVCFDEKLVQLLGDTHDPQPVTPGQVARYDYEYERLGTANLFMSFQPLAGWREVVVTTQRTSVDFAHQVKALVDEHFPAARVIRLVIDNLNTHTISALYETFPPSEARRLARKLEIHYTPKHGSWLNMVEIELSILSRQCLKRRISTAVRLQELVTAWATGRNDRQATVHWRFTTNEARTKLHRLYPALATTEDDAPHSS
jgi:hypothetical protein